MRSSLFVVGLGLALVGCSGSGGEACSTEGDTRCMDGAAETCTGGEWTMSDDCAADGGECMQDASMADGMAHCMTL